MKHITLAALLTLTSIATPTFAAGMMSTSASGYYIQGDLGLSNLRAKTEWKDVNSWGKLKNNYKESGLLPRISIGYGLGNFRVAADYTHYKKAETSSGSSHSSTQAQGVGVSAIYDIPLNNVVNLPIQPYVGGRLSLNKIKQDVNLPGYSSKSNETKLSPGVMAGVGYQLDQNMTIDAGYRYNHFNSKLKAHEATVGLRYTFR